MNNELGIKIILFFLFSIFYFLFPNSPVSSQTMSNNNYMLQMSNLNTAAGNTTGSSYNLNLTVGQTAAGLSDNSSYKIKAGFQYAPTVGKFSFSVSQAMIDFGTLTATNPVTRTSDLTVTTGNAFGYSVLAHQNHPLKAETSQAVIPDTTCDNGACNSAVSAAWTNTLAYGFGYRCDNVIGNNCVIGFSNPAFYKQFANNSNSEASQTVMSGISVRSGRKSTITYKVNISGAQPAGVYTNTITYVATPTF